MTKPKSSATLFQPVPAASVAPCMQPCMTTTSGGFADERCCGTYSYILSAPGFEPKFCTSLMEETESAELPWESGAFDAHAVDEAKARRTVARMRRFITRLVLPARLSAQHQIASQR